MTPHAFYAKFTSDIHALAERVAQDEIALAKQRIETRVMQDVKNFQVQFEDTLLAPRNDAMSSQILEVRIRLDFSGLSPRR